MSWVNEFLRRSSLVIQGVQCFFHISEVPLALHELYAFVMLKAMSCRYYLVKCDIKKVLLATLHL